MKLNIGNHIYADSFNELFTNAINAIFHHGEWVSPRGLKCKELISTQLILKDPSRSILTLKKRKLNYAYLIIEKMMYISQFQDPAVLIAYNQKMQNYLNTGNGLFDGAYGPRIGQGHQLDYVYRTLLKDPDSRQAVITINDYTDRRDSKDVPCTLYFNFLIRDNKLNMITGMRSNDILFGTCLDIPAFCFLQEAMAFWLGINVGYYIHNASSLHYYEEFEEQLLSYTKEENQEVNEEIIPQWTIPYKETKEALNEFWEQEQVVREYKSFKETQWPTINKYLERLLAYWEKKNESKQKS